MNRVQVPFDADPAARAARLVAESGLFSPSILVVAPTQRFKTFFAEAMQRELGGESCILPTMIASKELLQDLAAETGCPIANESERLRMLHRACAGSEPLAAVAPADALKDYRQFRALAGQLLKSIHELCGEEVDVPALMRRAASSGARDHPAEGEAGRSRQQGEATVQAANVQLRGMRLHALCDVYLRYGRVQEEEGVYDGSFLYPRVTGGLVRRYAAPYRLVVLVAPLALTGLERRVYGELDDRLTVLYQDTDAYDFSAIMTMGGRTSAPGSGRSSAPGSGTEVRKLEASSRMEEVVITLSLVRETLREVEAHRVAVVNIDSLACGMLYDALRSAGIEVNISEGLPVARSALYRFLTLVRGFFGSGGETRFFLELLRNELFIELWRSEPGSGGPVKGGPGAAGPETVSPGAPADYQEIKRRLVESGVFRVSASSAPVMERPRLRSALARIQAVYGSRGFGGLHENLARLFSVLSRGRTYAYHAVSGLLLDAALELTDLEAGGERRPSEEGRSERRPEGRPSKEKRPEGLPFPGAPGSGGNPFEVFLQHTARLRYPVQGSMRRGVQILGLLETRGIRFDTVIVPSFNEGFFPVQPETDLFLPVADRRDLGIGTFLEREELELYYAIRIIDASRKTFLLSLRDSAGEYDVPSRFGVLIGGDRDEAGDLELPVAPPPGGAGWEELRGDAAAGGETGKGAPDLPVLAEPASSYSRLDIDRIKRCPVQYYLARVLGIPEPLEPSEEIQPRDIGMLAHELLYRIYRDVDFESAPPSFQELRGRMDRVFEAVFRKGLFPTREEALAKAVLRRNLLACLRFDARRFAGGYRPLTGLMERELEVRLPAGPVLKGRIDRVDRTPEGEYVVLDYKTGTVPDARDHLEERDFKQVQLAFYGLLFTRTHPGAVVRALSYFDVTRFNAEIPVVQGEEVPGYLERFERHLEAVIHGLHRGELGLAADRQACAWCPYPLLCRRSEQ